MAQDSRASTWMSFLDLTENLYSSSEAHCFHDRSWSQSKT